MKYRLPIPDADPTLSVTSHEIVWTPLASAVLSKVATPSAFTIPGYCAAGKSAVRSARLVQPEGAVLRKAPSTTTCAVPPAGGSARYGVRESTHPKLTTLALTVPPWMGVSIAPNGAVAVPLLQVIVLVPSVVECPSASSAIA